MKRFVEYSKLSKKDKKKEYLPPSKAEGLERVNKYPKSKNPINRPFLHRVGSEVGRRRMIERRDKY